ncbi:hypothetical protein HDU79_010176 [Rhizoclosmatium sp. JEL0117]|nr:hypothetical protein HDU79_010176 [Rhizoclosmatium sp. JEL0117]
MAGSGKSTFMQRLTSSIHSAKKTPYVVNLDPAVGKLPFGCNIDIQDVVNYKQVMKQYGLGPNGGIITSLNLFTTKFDQVLDLIHLVLTPPPSSTFHSRASSNPGLNARRLRLRQLETGVAKYSWPPSGLPTSDTVAVSAGLRPTGVDETDSYSCIGGCAVDWLLVGVGCTDELGGGDAMMCGEGVYPESWHSMSFE